MADQSGNWTSWFEENPSIRVGGSGAAVLWPPQKTTYGLDISGITGGDIYEIVYLDRYTDISGYIASDTSGSNVIKNIADISNAIIDISSETLITYYRIQNGETHHCFVDKYGLQIINPPVIDLSAIGLSSKTVLIPDQRGRYDLLTPVQDEIKSLIKRQVYHNITKAYYVSGVNLIYVPYLKV